MTAFSHPQYSDELYAYLASRHITHVTIVPNDSTGRRTWTCAEAAPQEPGKWQPLYTFGTDHTRKADAIRVAKYWSEWTGLPYRPLPQTRLTPSRITNYNSANL